MKRIILTVTLLSASLLASNIDQVKQLYEAQKYEQCIDSIGEYKEYGNPKMHWYWAVCAEAMGDEESAIAAYERVLMLDDSNIEAALKLIALYQKSGMQEQADELAKKLHYSQLTQAQRNTLNLYAQEPEKDLALYRVRFGMNVGYDSNINSSPQGGYLDNLGQQVEKTDSGFLRTRVDLKYMHDVRREGELFVGGDLNLYMQDYWRNDDFDIKYAKASAGIGYRSGNFAVYIPVQYERLYYLHRDLLQGYGIQAMLNVAYRDNVIIQFNPVYKKHRYINESDKNRDDAMLGAAVGVYYYYKGADYLYARGSYESYDAKAANPTSYIERDLLYMTVGVYSKALEVVDLNLDYSYITSDYDETVSNGEKREDERHQVTLKVGKEIKKGVTLQGEYNYVNNDSNLGVADYKKQVAMIGLLFKL